MTSNLYHIAYVNNDFQFEGKTYYGGVGGVIWGASTSARAAAKDAVKWLDEYEPGLSTKVEVIVQPCSSMLYNMLQDEVHDGTNTPWHIDRNGWAYPRYEGDDC